MEAPRLDRRSGDGRHGPAAVSARTAIGYFLSSIAVGLLFAVLAVAALPAHAAERIVIPEVSAGYRLQLERAAGAEFGLNAPVARLAAQIHQESHWKPTAASKYAQGLAQFTPATAAWIPSICSQLDEFDRWNPQQSLRALACYDAWLHKRVRPLPAGAPMQSCSRWNFTFRAYNGGEGWLLRERAATARAGGNPNDYRDVAKTRIRAEWAHKENTSYPLRILYVIEPQYIAAGWPAGDGAC